MKKSMCITYIVEDKLYVNVTNKCSNRCEFCIRNNGDGAYGSDSLWLEREPTRDEILDSIFSRDLTVFPELVFLTDFFREIIFGLSVCNLNGLIFHSVSPLLLQDILQD